MRHPISYDIRYQSHVPFLSQRVVRGLDDHLAHGFTEDVARAFLLRNGDETVDERRRQTLFDDNPRLDSDRRGETWIQRVVVPRDWCRPISMVGMAQALVSKMEGSYLADSIHVEMFYRN